MNRTRLLALLAVLALAGPALAAPRLPLVLDNGEREQLQAGDTLDPRSLPTPTASTLGGIQSLAAVTHDFLTAISTSGVASQARPACADLSDAGVFCNGADAAGLTGTVSINRFNGGTGASSTTFLRGDGAWATPPGGAPGGTSGQLQYNNAGAFGGFTLAGDCTFSVPNVTCTKTSGVAFAASATTDTTNASNISSGSLAIGRFPSIAANTVIGNPTGSAAVPTAAVVPSCGGAANGLTYSPGAGFGCNTFGSGTGSPGALVLLETHTASGAANLDFTSWQSASYDEYIIELSQITPSTTGLTLDIRASTNGGSTFDTANNYGTSQFAWSAAGSTVQGTVPGGAFLLFPLNTRSMSTTATQALSGQVRMYAVSGLYTQLLGDLLGPDSVDGVGNPQAIQMRGLYTTATLVNALRFFTVAAGSPGGAFSGTIRIYGVSH